MEHPFLAEDLEDWYESPNIQETMFPNNGIPLHAMTQAGLPSDPSYMQGGGPTQGSSMFQTAAPFAPSSLAAYTLPSASSMGSPTAASPSSYASNQASSLDQYPHSSNYPASQNNGYTSSSQNNGYPASSQNNGYPAPSQNNSASSPNSYYANNNYPSSVESPNSYSSNQNPYPFMHQPMESSPLVYGSTVGSQYSASQQVPPQQQQQQQQKSTSQPQSAPITELTMELLEASLQ